MERKLLIKIWPLLKYDCEASQESNSITISFPKSISVSGYVNNGIAAIRKVDKTAKDEGKGRKCGNICNGISRFQFNYLFVSCNG